MQDGTLCLKSKIVTNFLKRVLDWPGNSPDQNPIENLWVDLKYKVSEQQPSSLKHLKNMIKTVWTGDKTSEYCCKLTKSLPKHMKMVIENKSGNTKYGILYN